MDIEGFERWLADINRSVDMSPSAIEEAFRVAMNPPEFTLEKIYRDWLGDINAPVLESTNRRHAAIWRIIRIFVARGMSDNDILKQLQTMSGIQHLRANDRKTIAKVRNKGLSGTFN